MPILVNKYLMGRRFAGVALWPFIVIKKDYLRHDRIFLNHERIHLRQQLELGVLFFYIWYVIEFFLKWLRFKNAHIAYQNISFEKEAYQNENDLHYLTKRSFWKFLVYL
ncbi:hypothetical protein NBT05_01380 [Aquimarina sp. ERC-38]|uniref:hypothetical protein n=1 Tax=Aquimarina sp. ERC-38 TaxID=2949996 RepID=UPI002247FD5E|nr:hypothetical protein [Aquimarina sp. ERC-38]UZO81143.1 hypothetical protein NBT05_01380 [Aquimarina sp. ERC-38]